MKRLIASLISFLLALIYYAAAAGQATAAGSAPIAENLELKTYVNVTVGGMLSAFDPDGGALQFVITTDPVKGKLQLDENGSFLYTPQEDKRGRDYFGYKAVDTDGNLSQEATVIVQILKPKKQVMYGDMHGKAEEYAAVFLSEADLFTGRQICGTYCFEPDSHVTRGEFLSMCMDMTGEPLFTGTYRTGYEDDECIPAWQKAYASAAAVSGIYAGTSNEDGVFFSGDETITRAQAAAILDQVLKLDNASNPSGKHQTDSRLARADSNMGADRLQPSLSAGDQLLNRAAAAQMLAAAYAYVHE